MGRTLLFSDGSELVSWSGAAFNLGSIRAGWAPGCGGGCNYLLPLQALLLFSLEMLLPFLPDPLCFFPNTSFFFFLKTEVGMCFLTHSLALPAAPKSRGARGRRTRGPRARTGETRALPTTRSTASSSHLGCPLPHLEPGLHRPASRAGPGPPPPPTCFWMRSISSRSRRTRPSSCRRSCSSLSLAC